MHHGFVVRKLLLRLHSGHKLQIRTVGNFVRPEERAAKMFGLRNQDAPAKLFYIPSLFRVLRVGGDKLNFRLFSVEQDAIAFLDFLAGPVSRYVHRLDAVL